MSLLSGHQFNHERVVFTSQNVIPSVISFLVRPREDWLRIPEDVRKLLTSGQKSDRQDRPNREIHQLSLASDGQSDDANDPTTTNLPSRLVHQHTTRPIEHGYNQNSDG
jgi:hypothetical protein